VEPAAPTATYHWFLGKLIRRKLIRRKLIRRKLVWLHERSACASPARRVG